MSPWNALIRPPRAVFLSSDRIGRKMLRPAVLGRLRYKFRPIYPDLDYIKGLNPSMKRAFEKNVFQLAVV